MTAQIDRLKHLWFYLVCHIFGNLIVDRVGRSELFVVVLLSLSGLVWLGRLGRFSGVRVLPVLETSSAHRSSYVSQFVFSRVNDIERIAQRVWNWLLSHFVDILEEGYGTYIQDSLVIWSLVILWLL